VPLVLTSFAAAIPLNTALSGVLRIEVLVVESDEIPKVVVPVTELAASLPKSVVPAMMMLLHMPATIAKGTSLAVIIPTSLMGTWRNRAKKNADLKSAAILGLGGIMSAYAGGWISDKMSDSVSNTLFATLLVVVAVRLLRQVRAEDKAGVVQH
jgi:hypothetical protein